MVSAHGRRLRDNSGLPYIFPQLRLEGRYEKEAQAAQQLASKHFMMRQVYAAARAMERHDQAGEHCAFVAKKYQEMAKEYETLAAMHRMVAEQLK
jgi:hypothetical protein